MACFKPLSAHRAGDGSVVVLNRREGRYGESHLQLRCGQCVGCRIDRARMWSLRIVHEAELHDHTCFVTLTYDKDHVPRDGGLRVSDWQKFAKRLRKRVGRFRFFHCGEYGDTNLRPHYHACLFGLDFSADRVLVEDRGPANKMWTSGILDSVWGLGSTTIGVLNRTTAEYVARYVVKKMKEKREDFVDANEEYRRIDPATGEEYYVRREYITMSRRPGIGAAWLERFHMDVYPSDEVVSDGRIYRPPDFYDKKMEERDPVFMEGVREARRRRVDESNNTPERLLVREKVLDARLGQLKRSL